MKKMERKNQRKSQQTLVKSLRESITRILQSNKPLLVEHNKDLFFGKHRISKVDKGIFKIYTNSGIHEVHGIDSAIVLSYYTQLKDYKKIMELKPYIDGIKKYFNEIILLTQLIKNPDCSETIYSKLIEYRYRYDCYSKIIGGYSKSILRN